MMIVAPWQQPICNTHHVIEQCSESFLSAFGIELSKKRWTDSSKKTCTESVVQLPVQHEETLLWIKKSRPIMRPNTGLFVVKYEMELFGVLRSSIDRDTAREACVCSVSKLNDM